MTEPPQEVHDLEPDVFQREVRSFEFWFDAVRGYLDGLHYGHAPDTPEVESTDEERDRLITVLCNYCVGETTALEGAGGLIQIAPNHAAKVFLSTQAVDEGRHLEVLIHRLLELGVTNPEEEIACRASRSLLDFRSRVLDFVRSGDWSAALFAQNVILESMEFSVFQMHAQRADPRTREVLQGIVKDERRHIGFGENELGARMRDDSRIRGQLIDVRDELDSLVLETFQETMNQIDADRADRIELGRHYLAAVERLGFA
jgi:1,2-phenylacetyl-CoA epoxidase catalytic subunit